MYSYHGWLSTSESFDTSSVRGEIQELNCNYPVSCDVVNGEYHIAFSGNPNRDTGGLKKIIELLISKKLDLSGCVYVNDASDSEKAFIYQVIKVLGDRVTFMDDRNFASNETDMLFR